MTFKFKKSLDNLSVVQKAAQRRVQDIGPHQLTRQESETRARQYLGFPKKKEPFVVPGGVLDSHESREYLRDIKFFISAENGQLSQLESQIENSSQSMFGLLADIQHEADGLNSLISEEEIKLLGNYDRVHFNSFVRQIDMGLSAEEPEWMYDYKTELPFQDHNVSTVLRGTGVVLPIRERVAVPIIDVVLVGEETDVGDSRWPIMTTDPRNVFLPNKVFRHVIIRKEHDSTSRKFNYTPSYCTVQLELAGMQLINFLVINPVGHRSLKVEQVQTVNESGEEVEIEVNELEVETNKLLLFEPVRTRYLKIKFRAFAPVSKMKYDVTDWKAKELNDILRGVGWTYLLPEHSEGIEGRVFDFSLESLHTGLFVFEPTGIFRSKPVPINKPIGLDLSSNSSAVRITDTQRAYGSTFTLPEGLVLNEHYIGLELKDTSGNTRSKDLIPVPDTYPTQREFLPLIGGVGRVKLFPNMLWDLEKFRIISAIHQSPDSNPRVRFDTDIPHGLAVGDSIGMLGSTEYPLNGVHIVDQVVNDAAFRILVTSNTSTQLLDENTLPRLYGYITGSQGDPLVVYKGNIPLILGTDYKISLDGGGTYISRYRGSEYLNALTDPHAGNFRIKFLNPDYSAVYWIEYRVLKDQFLSKDNGVRLRNGRVVFSRVLSRTSGTVSSVIVTRTEGPNQHLTPIVLFYALKVREDVS